MHRKSIQATALVCGLTCTAALAIEGGLQAPANVDSNLTLTLDTVPVDLNPSDVLQVFVGEQSTCCTDKLPIAGHYQTHRSVVTFDPAFDFIAGQPYTARYRTNRNPDTSTVETYEFIIQPQTENLTPQVLAIFPSGKVIPENTLRFYLHFSTPMQPHVSRDFIKLIDSAGKPDTSAFMAFKQELWNEDRTRLTLLMDPGRIKRGVAQNLRQGPALLEGNDYAIVVEKGWHSATGVKTTARYEKPLEVSAALRSLPNIQQWNISPLRVQTTDPLVIDFDRPFDRVLALSSITILDGNGQAISGTVSIENNETRWRFVPDFPWKDLTIHIDVNPEFEDVAGNNFNELLDHPFQAHTALASQHRVALEHNLLPR